jgi:hypothetical protein
MAKLHTFTMKKRLDYGMMYFMRYNNPVTKNLKIWDKAPLIIPLFFNNKVMLAVNIHWIPARYRRGFIQMVMLLSEKVKKSGRQKMLVRLYYDTFKRGVFRFALGAIRKYYINRITNLQELPPEFWDNINPSDGRYKSRIYRRP